MTPKQNGRPLRTGFTTGAAAAAAAKGALWRLLTGEALPRVRIRFLTGAQKRIPIHSHNLEDRQVAVCTVVKDAGDDPDVTHGAVIGARVTFDRGSRRSEPGGKNRVQITGGTGVGKVTKPGLEVPPGEWAINSGPRKMIRRETVEVLEKTGAADVARVHVEVFVPKGVELAKKTLNDRLGIVGGLSILGTTGIERPMSHEAYLATIAASLSIARAAGIHRVVLTTGRRSERFAQRLWPHLPEEAFIQIGDFFKDALTAASGLKLGSVRLCVFFGKAVKMAQGIPHTHAATSRLTLDRLAEWALDATGNRELAETIQHANTARHAFFLLRDTYPEVILQVGRRMVGTARRFAGPSVHVRGVILDFEGGMAFDSKKKSSPRREDIDHAGR